MISDICACISVVICLFLSYLSLLSAADDFRIYIKKKQSTDQNKKNKKSR